MKSRKLQLFALVLVIVTHIGIQAQSNNGGDREIVFEEDFNGWTSIEDEGWFKYSPESSNWVSPTGESINFFKQVESDWMMLISPEIDMTDADLLTFFHQRGSSVEGQKLEVGVMTDPTNPSTFILLNIVDINSSEWTSEGTETVLSGITGLYHIVINVAASSPPPYTYLFIDDLVVTSDGAQANWPSYVTDLVIIPDENGANSATISWTNPSTEADGGNLTDLDSVVILRNGEWAYTLENPVIGGSESVPVSISEPGLFVFTLTAYNDEGGSVPIYNDPPVWVGLDTPGAPENLILTSTNDTIATLNWDTPSQGAHGQYFDGVVGTYKIVRADGAEYTVQGDILTFTEEVDIPGTYSYEVVGINTSGEGEVAESNTEAFYFDGLLLAEDFWVSVPAFEWELQGESINTWYHWPTDYAGSNNYWEMIFHPDANEPFNGIARVVSPVLNSQDFEAMSLRFRHYHNWTAGSYTFKIQTTSDGGNTWSDVYSLDVDGSLGGESKLVVINNADVGSENFQFSFVFEGNSLNLEFLTIDEVRLFEAAEVDLVATNLILPEIIEPDDVVSPVATIESWGSLDTEFTATMTFSENDEIIYLSEINSTIEGGGTMELAFDDWVALEGNYETEFTVTANNDVNTDNNTLTKSFSVLYLNAQRTLVVCEEGTGTWCGYCPGAAMGLDELVENNWPVAVIAYHNGDDYETEEGIERLSFYEVAGYPTVIFDGVESIAGGSSSESMYESYLPVVQDRLSIPAAASIEFYAMSIIENTLSVTVFIESGSPISGDNIVLQAVLTESHIPESWQGQDELNFVERTMLQGSTGASIDLSDQTEWVIINLDLNPAWIKTNSELVVFVQNLDTKEIYNGNKVDLITVSIKENEKWIGIYPNPARDFITISNCGDAEVNIYTVQGQKVLTKNISGQSAKLDVSKLKSGMHVLEIIIDGKRYTEKILIAK